MYFLTLLKIYKKLIRSLGITYWIIDNRNLEENPAENGFGLINFCRSR